MEGLPIKSQTEGIMFHVSPLLFSASPVHFFSLPGEASASVLQLSILLCPAYPLFILRMKTFKCNAASLHFDQLSII